MRSAELYRGLLRNHIDPWIGHLDLADVIPRPSGVGGASCVITECPRA